MDEKGIKKQLDRIELYTMLAAKNVLNSTEAAFILGMTPQGVRQKVRDREIAAYKPNQNRLYFQKKDLEHWMLQNRRKTTEELEQAANRHSVI